MKSRSRGMGSWMFSLMAVWFLLVAQVSATAAQQQGQGGKGGVFNDPDVAAHLQAIDRRGEIGILLQ